MLATRWLAAACAVLAARGLRHSAAAPRAARATSDARTVPRRVAGEASRRASSRLAAGGLDAAGYLAVADRLVARLCARWDARGGHYRAGSGSTTQVNADLLLVYSGAALAGHRGPARDDARAVAIARFLTGRRIFRGGASPGWRAGPTNRSQHEVFQAETIEGLQAAYAARRAIGLDARTAARIRHQIAAVAGGERWRWPAVALNQFNWNATVFAADAAVNGRGRALATALGRHIARFTRQARGSGTRPGNFGPGLRFHYQPARFPHARMNFDSPEYANIVLSFARVYRAGPRRRDAAPAAAPPAARVGAARDQRLLDPRGRSQLGYGPRLRALAAAQEGRPRPAGAARASRPRRELQPSARWGAWAKWLLDRGLTRYVALTEREDAIPSALAYGVNVVPQNRGNAYLAAARHAANAMRALPGRRSARARRSAPPALYAFDPDTGRLAVTTPALQHGDRRRQPPRVPVRRARPRTPARRRRRGRGHARRDGRRRASGCGSARLRTQYGNRAHGRGASTLRLVRAPRGAGASAATGTPARVRRTVPRPPRARNGSRRHGRVPLHADAHRGALDGAQAGRRRHVPELGPPRPHPRAAAERLRHPQRPHRLHDHAPRRGPHAHPAPPSAARQSRSRPDARGLADRHPPHGGAKGRLRGQAL